MGLVYGIDFGTSNSAIMVGLPDGRVRRIRNPVESVYEIPSVVCMRSDDTIAVGSVAWRMRMQRSAWYREEFKREIGSSIPFLFPPETTGDMKGARRLEVNFLVAQVLRMLRELAEREVPGDVDLVVITVPASWQAGNRHQMRRAAEIAGFDTSRVRFVTEPEAAVAYAVQEHLGLHEQTLLVYDLGGGTFDCAIVRGSKRSGYEVLGDVGGLDNVGGVHFTKKISDLIESCFPQEMELLRNAPGDDIRAIQRRLQIRDTCENAKRVLSTEPRFEGLLPELAPDAEFILDRAQFAKLISPMLMETINECERLLGNLSMDWGSVDMVVPVGGSSRSPIVGETIAQHSGKRHTSVLRVEDPELAVVHGAVLRALALANPSAHGHAAPRAAIPVPPVLPVRQAAPSDGEPLLSEPRFESAAGSMPTITPRPQPVTSETPMESVPLPVADAAAPAPSTGPPGPRRPTENFPESGITFAARQNKALARVWRWRRYTTLVTLLAADLAITNFFNIPGATRPGHGVTQGQLTIAAYSIAFLSIVLFLMMSLMLNKALRGTGATLTTAASIGCAAAAHYFLHGWPGWVILIPALLVASFAWLAALIDSIPWKNKFVSQVKIDPSGLSLTFADSGLANFSWADIESVTETSNMIQAVIAPKKWRSSNNNRLNYTEATRTVELFGRFHFAQERQVLEAIGFYSEGHLAGNDRH